MYLSLLYYIELQIMLKIENLRKHDYKSTLGELKTQVFQKAKNYPVAKDEKVNGKHCETLQK